MIYHLFILVSLLHICRRSINTWIKIMYRFLIYHRMAMRRYLIIYGKVLIVSITINTNEQNNDLVTIYMLCTNTSLTILLGYSYNFNVLVSYNMHVIIFMPVILGQTMLPWSNSFNHNLSLKDKPFSQHSFLLIGLLPVLNWLSWPLTMKVITLSWQSYSHTLISIDIFTELWPPDVVSAKGRI